ncbi:MAG: hypothetical protein AAF183_02205 [Pseudomonadota bacterium]
MHIADCHLMLRAVERLVALARKHGVALRQSYARVARLTGRKARRAYVDRGHRGHGVARDGLQVVVSHSRGVTSPTIRREMRRRNGNEPVLGHMKADDLLERNQLSGPEGDAVNAILCAILCAIGHTCRLLLAWFRRLLALLLRGAPAVIAGMLRAVAAIINLCNARRTLAA